MLPYLEALTLDNNKIDLLRRANRRLAKFDETLGYAERAFNDVESLLQQIA